MSGWGQLGDNYQDQSSIIHNQQQGQTYSVQQLVGSIFSHQQGFFLQKNAQNLNSLKPDFFTQLVWFSSPQSSHEKVRDKIFRTNFDLIYNKSAIYSSSVEDIKRKLRKQGQLLSKIEQIFEDKDTNIIRVRIQSLYSMLVICTNETIEEFVSGLTAQEHCYKKCVGFRLQKLQRDKYENYIYKNVEQVYDIIDIIKFIEKSILDKIYNHFKLLKEINIYLTGEIEQVQENMLTHNHKKQQLQQQQQDLNKNLKVCPLKNKIELGLCRSLLMEEDFYIFLDPQTTNFVLLTTEEIIAQCQDIKSQHLLIKTLSDLETTILSQKKPPLLFLITSQIADFYDMIDRCPNVVCWLKCCWGRDYLTEQEDLDAFDEKYGANISIDSSFAQRVCNLNNLDELKTKLEQFQTKAEELLNQQ